MTMEWHIDNYCDLKSVSYSSSRWSIKGVYGWISWVTRPSCLMSPSCLTNSFCWQWEDVLFSLLVVLPQNEEGTTGLGSGSQIITLNHEEGEGKRDERLNGWISDLDPDTSVKNWGYGAYDTCLLTKDEERYIIRWRRRTDKGKKWRLCSSLIHSSHALLVRHRVTQKAVKIRHKVAHNITFTQQFVESFIIHFSSLTTGVKSNSSRYIHFCRLRNKPQRVQISSKVKDKLFTLVTVSSLLPKLIKSFVVCKKYCPVTCHVTLVVKILFESRILFKSHFNQFFFLFTSKTLKNFWSLT